jgi:phage terminase large subunit
MEISLKIPDMLSHQRVVFDGRDRFNVLDCGRSWGKSFMGKILLTGIDDEGMNGALNGYNVAYCAPIYKMTNKVWKEFLEMVGPLISRKSEQDKWVEFIPMNSDGDENSGWNPNGGRVEFWSLDNINAIRGNQFKRVVVDEARYVDELQDAWMKSLRQTLNRYNGDAWILSTPSGQSNFFYDLYCWGKDKGKIGWKSWQLPSNQNKTIDESEIEEARLNYPPLAFAQEYEAEFVSDGGTKWLYTFSEDNHVVEDLPYLRTFPVYLSFDFNANPVSCVAIQRGTNKFLHIFKEFSGDVQLDELCKMIRGYFKGSILFVTGDASGNRHDVGFSGRNQTYYTIIKEYLGISDRQLHLNRKNLLHNDSRMLCNTMFNSYPGLKISATGCPKLLNDIRIAEVDTGAGVAGRLRKDRGRFKMDLFDALRYHFQTYDLKFIKKYLYGRDKSYDAGIVSEV